MLILYRYEKGMYECYALCIMYYVLCIILIHKRKFVCMWNPISRLVTNTTNTFIALQSYIDTPDCLGRKCFSRKKKIPERF